MVSDKPSWQKGWELEYGSLQQDAKRYLTEQVAKRAFNGKIALSEALAELNRREADQRYKMTAAREQADFRRLHCCCVRADFRRLPCCCVRTSCCGIILDAAFLQLVPKAFAEVLQVREAADLKTINNFAELWLDFGKISVRFRFEFEPLWLEFDLSSNRFG